MKHAQIVERGMRFLRARRFTVVLCETKTLVTDEEPDCIGWKASGTSALLEAKASRADFHADRKKLFRVDPTLGMGRERWYAAPAGLLTVDDLPEGWGLVEFKGRSARVVREPRAFQVRNINAELALALTACRRATEGWGQKIFGDRAQTDALHPASEKRIAKLERRERRGQLPEEAPRSTPPSLNPPVAPVEKRFAGGLAKRIAAPPSDFNKAFPKVPVREKSR